MKYIIILSSFLLSSLIARENPFEPTQTYKEEIARMMELETGHPMTIEQDSNDMLVKDSQSSNNIPDTNKSTEEEYQGEIYVVEKNSTLGVVVSENETSTEPVIKDFNKSKKPLFGDDINLTSDEKEVFVKNNNPNPPTQTTDNNTQVDKKQNNSNDVKKVDVKVSIEIDNNGEKTRVTKIEKEELSASKKSVSDPIIVVKNKSRNNFDISQGTHEILPFITLVVENDSIEVKTKYKVFRKFNLEDDKKIVLDFRGAVWFYTRNKSVQSDHFKRIIMGNHKADKYFRIVLVTKDHPNTYNVTYDDEGVMVSKP